MPCAGSSFSTGAGLAADIMPMKEKRRTFEPHSLGGAKVAHSEVEPKLLLLQPHIIAGLTMSDGIASGLGGARVKVSLCLLAGEFTRAPVFFAGVEDLRLSCSHRSDDATGWSHSA